MHCVEPAEVSWHMRIYAVTTQFGIKVGYVSNGVDIATEMISFQMVISPLTRSPGGPLALLSMSIGV
jgi:hypothetical protein